MTTGLNVQNDYARIGVTTKYLGPTNYRGGRVKARRMDHRTGDATVTVEWDHALDVFDNHRNAIVGLLVKLGWDGEWAIGAGDAGYVAVQVKA